MGKTAGDSEEFGRLKRLKRVKRVVKFERVEI
jgi:hypothetical protein